ncbi:hypothetical protein ABW20_dc0103265 [Dactylellina cionopaga]|nr:hypothetical protein ABW20_dc0103265 [Dactylellina cionopaga]
MPAIASSSFTSFTPPTHGAFNLTLTKAIRGEAPSYLPFTIQFEYDYNPFIKLGTATVLSIGQNTTNQPMSIEKSPTHLSFMTKQRFWVTVDGSNDEFYAYRVVLDMDKDTGENQQAAVMIGLGAKLIVGTENWGATELL